MSVLPMARSLPKRRFAVSSVTTRLWRSVSAVAGLPSFSRKENIRKKEGVCKGYLFPFGSISLLKEAFEGLYKAAIIHDTWQILLHIRSQGHGGHWVAVGVVLVVHRVVVICAVQIAGVAVETVEAKFVQRIWRKKAEARDTQR
jgi:hypothetical protein